MSKTIEEVVDAGKLSSYADEWQALADRGRRAEFFQTYEWVTIWLECFWQNRPIRFLFARENGKLTGLLPLLNDTNGERGCCPRTLVLPVNPHARRSDLLYVGGVEELLDPMITQLKHSHYPLRLRGTLRDDSPLAQEAHGFAQRHGLHLFLRETSSCPVIHLDSSWTNYVASLSRHVRHEMQRKARRLEREGKVEFQVLNTLEDCDQGLQQVFQIEAASWKQADGSSFTADPKVGRFYSNLARRVAARGWLRIYLLLLNDQPVAHIFGVAYKDEYYALKTSYDSSFAALSPGTVIFFHALRDACEQGIRIFDLLGEETRWKSELATGRRDHVILCLYSKGAYSCHWRKAKEVNLKPWVRQHAPGFVAINHWLRKKLAEE